MKGFIEVPWLEKYTDAIIMRLVNIQHIAMVEKCEPIGTEIYLTPDDFPVRTNLSYAEVKKLIEEAQKNRHCNDG